MFNKLGVMSSPILAQRYIVPFDSVNWRFSSLLMWTELFRPPLAFQCNSFCWQQARWKSEWKKTVCARFRPQHVIQYHWTGMGNVQSYTTIPLKESTSKGRRWWLMMARHMMFGWWRVALGFNVNAMDFVIYFPTTNFKASFRTIQWMSLWLAAC